MGEAFFGGVFEEIASCAGGFGTANVAFVIMHGEDEDVGERRDLDDLAGGFDAIEVRHGDIDDGDIGGVEFGELDGFDTVRGFGDDGEGGIFFEDEAKAGAEEAMIVGEEDADGH